MPARVWPSRWPVHRCHRRCQSWSPSGRAATRSSSRRPSAIWSSATCSRWARTASSCASSGTTCRCRSPFRPPCRRGWDGSPRRPARWPRSAPPSVARSGWSFWRSWSAPRSAHSAVLELQRLDLITEERRRPSPEYRFRHGLVQEVAYSSLLEHDRRDAHRPYRRSAPGAGRPRPGRPRRRRCLPGTWPRPTCRARRPTR